MEIRKLRIGLVLCMLFSMATAQTGLKQGPWKGQLLRNDGKIIPFHFDVRTEKNKTLIYIINASERLRVDNIRYTRDSVFIEMPVFESMFRAKIISADRWEGIWTKAGSKEWQVMPFVAQTQTSITPKTIQTPAADVTGKWSVTFTNANKKDIRFAELS
jgi:hypothetical protein